MSWIQNISSTLKIWVFKKKLLKFSDRFRRDPQACFYCPEMCRFSCPTAETLRTNTVTPRGKMSLLHLEERGYSADQVAGSAEQRQWFLEQCTGCGRCTEYCLYEIDVGSNLRVERARYFAETVDIDLLVRRLQALEGEVVFAEKNSVAKLQASGFQNVVVLEFPYRDWEWGKLSADQTRRIGKAMSRCTAIWVESPELAWFLAKGVKEEQKALSADIRLVWQKFFSDIAGVELGTDTVFHESFYLSRLLPRLGYSIPMYERGFMPFHSGWNAWDCGGESYYFDSHKSSAEAMGRRFLEDLVKDGRHVKKIVCQCRACVSHLRELTNAQVVYWLDELGI